MGMFDNVICDYPLPGTKPSFVEPGYLFQTKDLDNSLFTYIIGEDGELKLKSHINVDGQTEEREEPENFSGTLEFYNSNLVGGGPADYTSKGEDAERVTYEANFINGKITDIKQTEYTLGPALPISKMKLYDIAKRPTAEEIKNWKAKTEKSYLGKTLYRLWGGQTEGYPVVIVAENKKQLVGTKPDGDFELISRGDFDRILYEDEATAKASRAAAKAEWDAEKAEWDQFCAEWHTARNANDALIEGIRGDPIKDGDEF